MIQLKIWIWRVFYEGLSCNRQNTIWKNGNKGLIIYPHSKRSNLDSHIISECCFHELRKIKINVLPSGALTSLVTYWHCIWKTVLIQCGMCYSKLMFASRCSECKIAYIRPSDIGFNISMNKTSFDLIDNWVSNMDTFYTPQKQNNNNKSSVYISIICICDTGSGLLRS